ncbi:MAG: antitoxin Xre/MbcA/ParS toxin-binding domain-containing protein [Actinomycetota bacterium]
MCDQVVQGQLDGPQAGPWGHQRRDGTTSQRRVGACQYGEHGSPRAGHTAASGSDSRWQHHDVSPRRETEERLLELKTVLDLARRVFSDEAARQWLHSPVPALDYEKPLDLVATGRWRDVVNVLLAFAEVVTA